MTTKPHFLPTALAILISLAATRVPAQTFEWAKSFGGGDFDQGNSITVDAAGNVYTTGYFQDTVDFDPGAGSANLTSAGSGDAFVQKLDAAGNFLWAKAFGGSADDIVASITVDAVGNVYTTGYFQGTVDFDPGAGTDTLTSAGRGDVFVQKLDAAGNFLWAKALGGSGSDEGSSITVDAAGNVYTTGNFEGTADFDPGAGSATFTSAGGWDVFIQKMSQGTTGMVDMSGGIRITAFPNPSTGLVQLTFEQALHEVAITVTDIQGKIVFDKQLEVAAKEQIQIDGAAGVYFLKVQTDSGQGVVKIVKE